MKELIILTVISGIAFLIFLVTLILGLIKKNKKLKLTSLILFIAFIGLTAWTGFKFVSKTYNKVTETLRPRTGEEIYDALFDKRQTDCVKILNYQDQVVPKIDYAIWLHFETCPSELKRILSRHEFTAEKLSTTKWDGKIPYGETLEWFNPTTLGDTIVVYEYSTSNSRNIQTIWMNLDSTKVFVRDILD
ncbi:MAG: hypothetical protein J0M29_21485 [Chitinophagales bacterium]|nr:hypothetical protein [Chitinophagales bacterium]